MGDRILQPVSFNVSDPYESELHSFALKQQKYFSRYVKRLIELDRIAKTTSEAAVLNRLRSFEETEVSNDDRNAVKGFL